MKWFCFWKSNLFNHSVMAFNVISKSSKLLTGRGSPSLVSKMNSSTGVDLSVLPKTSLVDDRNTTRISNLDPDQRGFISQLDLGPFLKYSPWHFSDSEVVGYEQDKLKLRLGDALSSKRRRSHRFEPRFADVQIVFKARPDGHLLDHEASGRFRQEILGSKHSQRPFLHLRNLPGKLVWRLHVVQLPVNKTFCRIIWQLKKRRKPNP